MDICQMKGKCLGSSGRLMVSEGLSLSNSGNCLLTEVMGQTLNVYMLRNALMLRNGLAKKLMHIQESAGLPETPDSTYLPHNSWLNSKIVNVCTSFPNKTPQVSKSLGHLSQEFCGAVLSLTGLPGCPQSTANISHGNQL